MPLPANKVRPTVADDLAVLVLPRVDGIGTVALLLLLCHLLLFSFHQLSWLYVQGYS